MIILLAEYSITSSPYLFTARGQLGLLCRENLKRYRSVGFNDRTTLAVLQGSRFPSVARGRKHRKSLAFAGQLPMQHTFK
jgi:hypothetical protein